MSNHNSPKMSVVILTPDHYETIRKTVGHLMEQTVRDQVELVIVAPSADKLDLDESGLETFLRYCVVEVGPIRSTAEARAVGVRRANAPVVVFAEDHCYPEPGWAEALIKAHREPWAAVGPVLCNANPNSIISWATFLVESSPWLNPAPAGITEDLQGRNSSYKRTLLLEYGNELGAMLEAESMLHWDLRNKGHQLYLEPAAKAHHLNTTRPSIWIRQLFLGGRLFASARARQWSLYRRLLYVGGAVLIPPLRLWRIIRELRRPGRPSNLLPAVLPLLGVGLVASALGEMVGYVFGAGNVSEQVRDLEFHRD